jgi:hypothetical protein
MSAGVAFKANLGFNQSFNNLAVCNLPVVSLPAFSCARVPVEYVVLVAVNVITPFLDTTPTLVPPTICIFPWCVLSLNNLT